jgi:hypothetical protein
VQRDLDAMDLDLPVQIVGINEAGYESGNDLMCAMSDLAWLQDEPAYSVWDTWSPVYRDVVILGADGTEIDAFNLTVNDLSEPDKYAALVSLLAGYATL